MKSICEEELSKNNWTVSADQSSCMRTACKPKNIYFHHSYPNSYTQRQDSEWGTIKTYDVAGCKPRSIFPKGNIQSFCGNPDFEYYWETTPWSNCCEPQHFQSRSVSCIRVDKNLNTKTKIDGNEQDSVCGSSAKAMPLLRRSCKCPRWRAKVICDEGI